MLGAQETSLAISPIYDHSSHLPKDKDVPSTFCLRRDTTFTDEETEAQNHWPLLAPSCQEAEKGFEPRECGPQPSELLTHILPGSGAHPGGRLGWGLG